MVTDCIHVGRKSKSFSSLAVHIYWMDMFLSDIYVAMVNKSDYIVSNFDYYVCSIQ